MHKWHLGPMRYVVEGENMTDKIVLAYSGGLDTSIAIKWIKENYKMDVVALTINVGGM